MISLNNIFFTADGEFAGMRIDKALAETDSGFTRSHIQAILKEQSVFVNGKPVSKSYRLCEGDEVSFTAPELKELDVEPENIPLDIVYEDGDLLVVNKPRGMVVHPAPGNYTSVSYTHLTLPTTPYV